ncbi:hypothetical protein CQA49_07260 [Helicobacter sp. MIT 00-7814]|uniref:hypothetical protein n=1 Tax=unclassified Helicobacter TaxID=2593540 RepID=UPI000E1F5517|nr:MULTISPECIES: hypothetical protein [unclassified Helicobacter]RDU52708.1 hypothetical protein CQA37_08240 [Helicobacter sp. MIT 99-10781]RDU53142.1 hypothetical protein CQA49_07260 [Helicobacter sp. MIT 00-7814]
MKTNTTQTTGKSNGRTSYYRDLRFLKDTRIDENFDLSLKLSGCVKARSIKQAKNDFWRALEMLSVFIISCGEIKDTKGIFREIILENFERSEALELELEIRFNNQIALMLMDEEKYSLALSISNIHQELVAKKPEYRTVFYATRGAFMQNGYFFVAPKTFIFGTEEEAKEFCAGEIIDYYGLSGLKLDDFETALKRSVEIYEQSSDKESLPLYSVGSDIVFVGKPVCCRCSSNNENIPA